MLKTRIFALGCLFFLPLTEKCHGDEGTSSLALIQPGRPGCPRAAEGFLLRLSGYDHDTEAGFRFMESETDRLLATVSMAVSAESCAS